MTAKRGVAGCGGGADCGGESSVIDGKLDSNYGANNNNYGRVEQNIEENAAAHRCLQ